MNNIESQTQILGELCRIMHISAEANYSMAICRFDYSISLDESWSVGAEFSYIINGEEKSAVLIYPERKKLSVLLPKLHKEVKSLTGGDWRAFTLNIDADGNAKTNFEYIDIPSSSLNK